jgi:hypothetical protein
MLSILMALLSELQVMCIQWQRLVKLVNNHELRDPSALAKLVFQFTSASASCRMSALAGVTMAKSRRQVKEGMRRPTSWKFFIMALVRVSLRCSTE